MVEVDSDMWHKDQDLIEVDLDGMGGEEEEGADRTQFVINHTKQDLLNLEF